jgi:OOP family OmpA-OmpF porin
LGFFQNTSWLSPKARETLAQLAAVLKADPNLQVVLIGHTDSLGSAQFNRLLSLNRARRAQHVLVEAGISRDRIEIHGVGSSQPLDTSPTAQARASNRRVEITLR